MRCTPGPLLTRAAAWTSLLPEEAYVSEVSRACPVCKQNLPRAYCVHAGVPFVRCGACASLYQGSAPDWTRIAAIYQDDYHQLRGHADNPAVEIAKTATTHHYLRMLERLHPPGRRLVEVGCSAGAGLAAAAAAGWDVQGVEVSAASAAVARKRPGVGAVHTGRLEDAPLEPGQTDVIALFDVLEHIDPPDETLATICRLLSPGGLVLIVTPDGGSLSTRLMGARWPHLFIEHVIMYSRRGLRGCLQRAGFRVERIGFAWKWVNLDMLVRHATIHRHVVGGTLLRLLGRILPGLLLRMGIPFNIGEFYVMARRERQTA
jgi:SAM-dependent methyltransferase